MRLISDSYHIIGRPYLARAYDLALLGQRTVSPNPMVGCVIVKAGKIVGEGYHTQAGGPHAEIVALSHAGEQARGATVYVTLEPCNHTGKTGPCVDALIEAGVARVVCGMPDPHLEASGGAQRLIEAGIEVEFAHDSRPFEELNRGWLHVVREGLPYVRVKQGLSLDASIALRPNEATFITGASGQEVTRVLRGASDGVLISSSTAEADNPSLTLRGVNGDLYENQPQRIVLIRSTVPNPKLDVFTDGQAPTIMLCPDNLEITAFDADHVSLVTYSIAGGLRAALGALAQHGINNLLVEAGQRLFTELYNARLINELVTVTAGGFLGEGSVRNYRGLPNLTQGTSGPPVLEHRFAPYDTKIYGDVVATMWRPRSERY